jgi:hypothetical protein
VSDLVEIYATLAQFRSECIAWREKLLHTTLVRETDVYKAVSSTMLSYIPPIMKNILELWIHLVKGHGQTSNIKQVRRVNELIRAEIRNGHWIRIAYEASEYRGSNALNEPKFDVIMCWWNDWPDAPKRIIALSEVASLYGYAR